MINYGSAITIPFRFGNIQGDVSSGSLLAGTGGAVMSTYDYRIIWRDRVYIAVFTELKERVMFPAYGTRVLSSLFDTEGVAVDAVKSSIQSAFASWLPELRLRGLEVDMASDSGTLNVGIEYILPDESIDVFATQVRTTTFDQYGNIIRVGS